MTTVVSVLCLLLAILLLAQVVLGVGYIAMMIRKSRSRPASDADCPSAAVILCLRGADPFLPKVLDAILDLDYPRFELHIVIDHDSDPARAMVDAVLARRGSSQVRVEMLDQPPSTCSLKCSSVAQAVSRLDPSIEIAALVDADTVPHRSWLRELVQPFHDPKIGATTGNRWYQPADGSLGSLVRYLWNAAAIVQMYWYSIPWGGTLALRTSVLRDGQILDRWRHAFCEDTMMFDQLQRRGLRVAFVPSLMMMNRESIGLGDFFRWMRRQLFTARLYHPGFGNVIVHGLATSAALAVCIVVMILDVVTGNGAAAAVLALAVVWYFLILTVLLPPMEMVMRQIAARRGEPIGWITPGSLVKLIVAIPLTSVVYGVAMLSALRLRQLDWRGVPYEVDGPWEVRLIEYRPYADTVASPGATHSL